MNTHNRRLVILILTVGGIVHVLNQDILSGEADHITIGIGGLDSLFLPQFRLVHKDHIMVNPATKGHRVLAIGMDKHIADMEVLHGHFQMDGRQSTGIYVTDRNIMSFSGIKKINSFDNEEFLMESNMGIILLKGEKLEIIKLDTYDGNVKIKGKLDSITYMDNVKKSKEESLIAKLFK